MNPQQLQTQQPKQEVKSTEQDIWTSAFDAQTGTSSPPPPTDIKANPVASQQGYGTVAQRQETPGKKPIPPVSATQVVADATKIYDICASYFSGDGADVIALLRGKPLAHLKALRIYYQAKYSVALEQHLESNLSTANYRSAMIFLYPALTLMQRLRLEKNLVDDNEEKMMAIVKAARPEELAQARTEGQIRQFMLDELDGMQLYETHKLVYPPAQYAALHWSMAMKVIQQADGLFWDDDDWVYMIIIDMTPAQRKSLYTTYKSKIDFLSASNDQLKKLCLGTETQVLKTSMDLATDGLTTYDNLAEKTVVAAKAKMDRKALLLENQKNGDQSGKAELAQIGHVENLAKPKFVDGAINPDSFLGDLEGDLSEGEFTKYAAMLGVSQYDQAKRMILNAVGWWDNDQEIKDAFASIKNELLRRRLWADADVQKALKDHLSYAERETITEYRDGDTYKIAEDKFLHLVDDTGWSDATYDELIQLLTSISDADRRQLMSLYRDKLAPFEKATLFHAELGKALTEAADTGKVSLEQAVIAGSDGPGTSDELIESTLDKLSDLEYFELRLGYALAHGFQVPASKIPSYLQQAARNRYAWLMAALDGEMGFDQQQRTQDIFLQAPSLIEMKGEGGMGMTMFILQQRIADKIATRDGSFGDRFVDLFSNTGGVADVKAVQILGLYEQLIADGDASQLDLAAMAAGSKDFNEAYDAHVAACDSAADVASTVAAIAVAVIVTFATAGVGAPEAAAGLAAYIGSLSAAEVVGAAVAAAAYKVAVSEAIGDEHFDVSDEGPQAAITGGVDGALTAITAGLAKALQESFYTAFKFSGKALASELTVGVIRSAESGLGYLGKQAAIGATRGAIDGAISGAIGNIVLTAADEATWRKGTWDTLTTFGASLLQGGLMGGLAGGAIGGGLAGVGGKMARVINELDGLGLDTKLISEFPISKIQSINKLKELALRGDKNGVESLLNSMSNQVDEVTINQLRKWAATPRSSKDWLELMLKKVGGSAERALKFTEEEVDDLVNYCRSMGLGNADIEAIFSVKIRKFWVDLPTMKKVATSLVEKSKNHEIQFKEGWDLMKAYREAQARMLEGRVLEPSEYLDEAYMQQHFKQFEGESSYLVTGEVYVARIKGAAKLGRPEGLFVATKSEISNAIAVSKGDISNIEKMLGFDSGSMQNKGGLYRIDVSRPEQLRMRFPNGFEDGSNEFWHPGGITSGGVKEVMIDQVENSPTIVSISKVIDP